MRAFFYLILTNLAVLLVLGVVITVLQGAGIIPPDVSYLGSFIICAIFGFGGSFISLMMSKFAATRAVGAEVFWKSDMPMDRLRNLDGTRRWLVQTVAEHAQKSGIEMPDVAIFDSPVPNAFATGPSKNNALVAISTGLLRIMSKDEAEAVIGHEVSHVANGDMVVMTLIQGVLNTFVYFFANLIAGMLTRSDSRESGFGGGGFLIRMVLQMVLGIGASLIAAWFSRRREFRADAGGAKLESPQAMAGALAALKRVQDAPSDLPPKLAAFGIREGGGLNALFSTHPPLDERIARLRRMSGMVNAA